MGSYAVGIDCGTTNMCAAVYVDDGVETVVCTDTFRTTMPSVLAFTKDGPVVGEEAKRELISNKGCTVRLVKRLIGQRFEDVCQKDFEGAGFKVVEGSNGGVLIELLGSATRERYTPQDITSLILKRMKDHVETQVGVEVTKAVVTVPAYFNDAQRNATREAVMKAGMELIRLINEPTAAAMTYALEKGYSGANKTVLVFDFGGGTLDVTLLTRRRDGLDVTGHFGDTHCGGEDIDRMLAKKCEEEFLKQHPEYSDRRDEFGCDFTRLLHACERAKHRLSSETRTAVTVRNFAGDCELNVRVTREELETMSKPVFEQAMKVVRTLLERTKVDKEAVDEVVLVGGTSRMPRVRQLLEDFFAGKKLHVDVNPDEAIARGAALRAAVALGMSSSTGLTVADVLTFPIGIEIKGGIMSVIAPEYHPVPFKLSDNYTTTCDNQKSAHISICEGCRPMAIDCDKLGEFTLDGLTPAPRGETTFTVTLEYDNCMDLLEVSAVEKSSGQRAFQKVHYSGSSATLSQARQRHSEAERYAAADAIRLRDAEARNRLDLQLYHLDKALRASTAGDDCGDARRAVSAAIAWLKEHRNASENDCQEQLGTLKRDYAVIAPLIR